MSGAVRDPAAQILAVAVPPMDAQGIMGSVGGGGSIGMAGYDVLFIVTEMGYVYRVVGGGTAKLVYTPVEFNEKGRQEP